jgi:peptidase C13-like protein
LLTSHGDANGFALQPPGRVIALTPQQVAATLDAEGIRNRVVIVSACYAGIFLPPLKNDDTIVMTAADAKSTSFGCAPETDWTYFGDAFFRQSLREGTDFENAFDHARVLIQGWELMDHVKPSNPQGYFGASTGRQTRAALCLGTERARVAELPAPRHATSLLRPQALSEAQRPRSSRNRSIGAADLMARMR